MDTFEIQDEGPVFAIPILLRGETQQVGRVDGDVAGLGFIAAELVRTAGAADDEGPALQRMSGRSAKGDDELWLDEGELLLEPPTVVLDLSGGGRLVDAALAGFDAGEVVTIPALPDVADWQAFEAARLKLLPNLSRNVPAARYGVKAVEHAA